MSYARRLRGIAGTALTWGLGWGIAGTVFGVTTLLTVPAARRAVGLVFLGSTVGWAITGAVAGLVFASALLLAKRRGSVHELVPRRITALGTLGGALLPLLGVAVSAAAMDPMPFGSAATVAGLGALLGGACARLSLAVARRAPDGPTESAIASGVPRVAVGAGAAQPVGARAATGQHPANPNEPVVRRT